jgi:uncharacterized protein
VFKLPIAFVAEGHTQVVKTAEPVDIDLDGSPEFHEPVQLTFDIQKVGREFFIKVRMQTTVDMICDRCAEPFTWNVDELFDLVFTHDRGLIEEEDEDIYLIQESTLEVDITGSIRQTLLLALPFKRLCHMECKGLCSKCGANLNEETCSCAVNVIDPRWEALKKLKH